MEEFTLNDLWDVLQEGWGSYIDRFNALLPDAQIEFLNNEGFESFHDLLAHIIGWWEEGLWVITGILEDPSFTWQDRNTDHFNQELVEKYRSWQDDDLILHFENVRAATLDLVSELPEDALTNNDIREWLHDNVIEHLEDHKIV